MSATPDSACDLCGLPILVPDHVLTTRAGVKRFCCEACLGIYEMLHEEELVKEHANDANRS